MPDRRSATLVLACIALPLTAAVGLWGALAPDALGSAVAGRWGQAVAEGTAAVMCALTARRMRGRERLAWALFATGEAIWALTDLVVGIGLIAGIDPSPPSVYDITWLAFYVPMFAGTVLLYGRHRAERGWQGLIDGLLVAGALTAFGWRFLLEPAAASAAGGTTGTVVNLLYPILDLTCLGALAWVLLRQGHGAPPWLRWVALAFGLGLAADVSYLLAFLNGLEGVAWMASVTYMLAGWLWAAAAIRRRDAGAEVWAGVAQEEPPLWSRAVPLVAGLAVVMLVAVGQGLVGLAAAVVIALAMTRFLLSLRVEQGLIAERDALLITDPLTGAHNRRFLADELPRAFARMSRDGHSLAAIAFDIDHFKAVNDTFGHPAGDALLTAATEATLEAARLGDLVFRLGGDEFVVLLPGAGSRGASEAADRIAQAIRGRGSAMFPGAGVSASFGVAAIPQHATDPEDLLHKADEALYLAKRAGRDRVVVYAADEAARAHQADALDARAR